MIPILEQLNHAIEAQPDQSRIDAAYPHLRAALCTLLNMDIAEAKPARQCPRCGTDARPNTETINNEDKFRVICAESCGRFTPWMTTPQDAEAEFYRDDSVFVAGPDT